MKILRRSLLGLVALLPVLQAAKPTATTIWRARVGDATVIQEGSTITVFCRGAAIRINTGVS